MIPQLKPDIYSCIADHLVPVHTSPHLESSQRQVIKAQADLLNMAKANKVRDPKAVFPPAVS